MKDPTRRKFITSGTKLTGLGLGSSLYSSALLAAKPELDEEIRKRREARYIMTFASPYPSSDWKVSPHMHQEIKKNIETITEGNIFVEIIDQGKGGVGTDLMADVNRNAISGALVSISNLTPIAKELNILNIPFWIPDQQSYLNLITSKKFEELIVNQVRSTSKLDVFFFYLPGFRTATSTKKFSKTIKVPNDLKGIYFRVPPSETLRQFYLLAGTTPRKIPWKQVAKAAEFGGIQAMDSGIIGLYSGPNNLRSQLGAISKINSVYDGWIAVVNQQWMKSLDKKTLDQLKEATETTFKEHLHRLIQVENNCETAFKELGVDIYTPTAEEKQEWYKQCGHERKEWEPFKTKILGDKKIFQQLLEATYKNNGYTFPS